MDDKRKYAEVKIRKENKTMEVLIGSGLKPEIIDLTINKWQSLIDAVAQVVNAHVGSIMKLNEDSLEVFVVTEHQNTSLKKNLKVELNQGIFCETVIGTQKQLIVTNSKKDEVWKNYKTEFTSYMGFPVNWPDGEVFGTVCLFDNDESNYSETYKELLNQVKLHIETDLQWLITNQKLQEKTNELEKLNKVKSRLLSLISHDVRGSVSTMDSFLKLILNSFDQYDKAFLKNVLSSLSQNTSAVYHTLENLLIWSKNDLLQLKANKQNFNLIPVFNDILAQFKHTIELKKFEIFEDYYSEKIMIYADEEMIRTSLRNIFSNATKYTENNGKIFIRVLSENDKTIIEIEDTGIGMHKNILQKLFTYSEDHSKEGTEGESSSGVGLFLTKDFLDKNGATVNVTSEIGKGTKFRVKI
jgi:signal transduction histidine kinase